MDKYHFAKNNNIWWLKKQWGDRASILFNSNKWDSLPQAIIYMIIHWGSMIIHKEDWTFQEERTYPKSDDPRNSPG